jgi:hypothetical protein
VLGSLLDMMKSLLGLTVLGALLCGGSGCIVVPRHHPSAVIVCPPGHYWDGYACRHNGHR